MRVPAAFLLLVVAALAAAGCGDSDGEDGAGGGEAAVVATTTIAGDLVRMVGGERVEVDTLVPADADPHGHEPRPSDAVAIAEAEVVVKSGGDLDEWLDDLIESAGGDAAEITLLDSVDAIEGGHAHAEDDGGTTRTSTPTGGRTHATRSSPSKPSTTLSRRRTPTAAPPMSATRARTSPNYARSTPRSSAAWSVSRPRSASS